MNAAYCLALWGVSGLLGLSFVVSSELLLHKLRSVARLASALAADQPPL